MGFVWWMVDGEWEMSDDPEVALLGEDPFIDLASPDSNYSMYVSEETPRAEMGAAKSVWCVDLSGHSGAIQAYARDQRDMMAILKEWLPIMRDLVAIERSSREES